MEDLGASVESVKNDVNQLKDQMSQILEALVALKNTRDNSATRNDEATSSNPAMLQIGALKPIMFKETVDGLHMIRLLIILHLMRMCKVL